MTKGIEKRTDPLGETILLFSKQYIDRVTGFYSKVNRGRYFDLFIKKHPLQYQRNDQVYLSYGAFCKKIKEMGICSNWKLNRKKNKFFKLSRRKINQQITAYVRE